MSGLGDAGKVNLGTDSEPALFKWFNAVSGHVLEGFDHDSGAGFCVGAGLVVVQGDAEMLAYVV